MMSFSLSFCFSFLSLSASSSQCHFAKADWCWDYLAACIGLCSFSSQGSLQQGFFSHPHHFIPSLSHPIILLTIWWFFSLCINHSWWNWCWTQVVKTNFSVAFETIVKEARKTCMSCHLWWLTQQSQPEDIAAWIFPPQITSAS